MGSFRNIQDKLHQFIRKYYVNELIKGAILFAAFGLIYLIFTLFVEHVLWLSPGWRSVLFYAFLGVEVALLLRFIAFPLFKLFGLQKGISLEDASRIIGNHFPEVDDKLLNVLQLNQSKDKSELFLASISQKSTQLQPIPFQSAIKFSANKKFLKYLAIPLLIWFFTLLSGNNGILKDSLNRVVNYQTAYEPPAPFSFLILNKELSSVEGRPFDLRIKTVGDIVPESAQIHYNDESYFLKDLGNGQFSFQFDNLKESVDFYIASNTVSSRNYKIEVIKVPAINEFSMFLDYPNYTGMRNETIANTGNALIPEGTFVSWIVNTQETDSVHLIDLKKQAFQIDEENSFSLTKRIRRSINYQIATSNADLRDYEKLSYSIQVIKDEHPKIEVKSDIDSVSRGPVQFAGQLSDDYGLSRLDLVYYDLDNKDVIYRHPIKIKRSSFEEFYYLFVPDGELNFLPGKDYELYFEVFDNDAVNGSKSSKSDLFKFHKKTKQELSDDLLKEQKQSLDDLDKNAKKTEKLNKDFEEFTDKLKKKSELEWNDKKEFEQFLKRQEQYQEMFEKQTDRLSDNLEELNENDETIQNKKEELQKRIEETKQLQKKEKLLEELRKLAEKLDKEGMIDKLDKLAERQKQEQRSLERLLEMTKRFYVEKKAVDIAQKLDSLSKQQQKLAENEKNTAEKQENLNTDFEKIKKELDELRKMNFNLRSPMNLPDTKREERSIEEKMKEATEELDKLEKEERELMKKEMIKETLNEEDLEKMQKEYDRLKGEKKSDSDSNEKQNSGERQKKAQRNQKSASKKMKQLSQSMNQSMQGMQGEMMEENIETLRAILENLVTFSIDQEALMVSLVDVDADHPSFPKKLKKQQLLKEHFEHIDDSLYVLSMRQPRLSSKIQEDLTEAHYNIDKSLENIAENRMQQGRSNQQYTMTAANNLADMLSDMLDSMMNPSMGEGEGKGESNPFTLPDIIKKQEGLSDEMKKGIKKANEKDGEKDGQEGDSREQMSGEQYQIYQQQQQLRQQLEQLLEEPGESGTRGNKALEKMKQLEQQLLDKGFTNEVLQNMLQLEHELLKLEDARLKQGKDNKREATTNQKTFQQRKIEELLQRKQFFNLNEILNREPLPLRTNYKKKVQEYFKAAND